MLYCPSCKLLTESICCPFCGSKKLRNADTDDYCFLTEKDSIWAGSLEELLTQNQIPFVSKHLLGDGLAARIGPAQERICFYDPYSFYTQAQELCCEFIA